MLIDLDNNTGRKEAEINKGKELINKQRVIQKLTDVQIYRDSLDQIRQYKMVIHRERRLNVKKLWQQTNVNCVHRQLGLWQSNDGREKRE